LKAEKLLRFLVALTCVLFIVSIFCPFLQAQTGLIGIPERSPGPILLWSFRGTYEYWEKPGRGLVVEGWWFADYWYRVHDRGALGVWIGPLLIFMFEAQVFTALFAALAILRLKRSLLLLSTLLNVFTLFCMWFVSQALSNYYAKEFQAGFWITFLTPALFLTTILLSWWFRRKLTHL